MTGYIVVLIGVISSVTTLWKSGRTPIIMDYSYHIENAYRIFRGQIPYKDFVLVLTPGTYYISAIIMKLFGTTYNGQLLYIMIVSFAIVVTTYLILSLLGKNKVLNILLLLPLVFTGHAVFAFPSYDMNAMLVALLGIYLLLKIHRSEYNPYSGFLLLGMMITLPSFFKQNIGLIYALLFAVVGCVHILYYEKHEKIKKVIALILGSAVMYAVFFGYLLSSGAFQAFILQTVQFPLTIRNIDRYFYLNLLDLIRYRSLFYYFPFIIIALLLLLKRATNFLLYLLLTYAVIASPFIYGYYLYLKYRNANQDMSFIPGYVYMYAVTICFVILIIFFVLTVFDYLASKPKSRDIFIFSLSLALVAFYLSPFLIHRIERATFNFFPIVAIFTVLMEARLQRLFPKLSWKRGMNIIVIGTTLHLAISLFQPDLLLLASKTGIINPNVNAVAMIRDGSYTGAQYGSWNKETDSMLSYVRQTIPANESVINFPGVDPFYYVLNRKPYLPYFQFNTETLTKSPQEYTRQIEKEKIQWIVVKLHLQCNNQCQVAGSKTVMDYISSHYRLKDRLKGYDIYKRF